MYDNLNSFTSGMINYPLLELMSEDDDWAWEKFSERLKNGDVPVGSEDLSRETKVFSVSSSRLPVLANWYALARRSNNRADGTIGDIAGSIMKSIVLIGGEKAINELKRLIRERAYPEVEWLSYQIIQIEDKLLSEKSKLYDPIKLLRLINKKNEVLVEYESDLWDCVCHAIDDFVENNIKNGEFVAGFWDDNKPKNEVPCQTVLWPIVKEKIKNYGVVNVEEKIIGPNKCDFWVIKPNKPKNVEVGVELKVANKAYGKEKLVQRIETQLYDEYLKPKNIEHGIFIVLWFSAEGAYDFPKDFKSKEELLKQVQKKCEELKANKGVIIKPYVIDLTVPYRKH